jgi:voltage-gated potassium channel
MWLRLRTRTATILDIATPGDLVSRRFDQALICLILINVVAVILESVPSLRQQWGQIFRGLEYFSVAVFSVEYLARVWSIVDNRWRREYAHPVRGRLRFMFTPMALIDLFAIAPFWLSVFFPVDLRFLRVARLLRILKLSRYSAAMNLLFEVLREEVRVIMAALFVVVVLIVLMASATFLVENRAQPEDFASIPDAMWWAVVTVTTVGYGDVVPVTPMGKILGSILGLIGVGMVALPAGILASGFNEAMHRRRNSLRREVDHALEDGIIDDDEHRQIRVRAESLSLSDNELNDILSEKTDQYLGLSCPHCGKRLDIE